MSVSELCEEEATEEKAEAAGAELKTKTPHSDVGNNSFMIPRFWKIEATDVFQQSCWRLLC